MEKSSKTGECIVISRSRCRQLVFVDQWVPCCLRKNSCLAVLKLWQCIPTLCIHLQRLIFVWIIEKSTWPRSHTDAAVDRLQSFARCDPCPARVLVLRWNVVAAWANFLMIVCSRTWNLQIYEMSTFFKWSRLLSATLLFSEIGGTTSVEYADS